MVYEKFRSSVLPPRTLQNLLRPMRGHCRRCVTRESHFCPFEGLFESMMAGVAWRDYSFFVLGESLEDYRIRYTRDCMCNDRIITYKKATRLTVSLLPVD